MDDYEPDAREQFVRALFLELHRLVPLLRGLELDDNFAPLLDGAASVARFEYALRTWELDYYARRTAA